MYSTHAKAAAVLVLAGLCISLSAQAQWRHHDSPFRATFEVTSEPNHPAAGLRVNVPTCNLSHPSGRDLFAYDEKGLPLSLHTLGPGTHNTMAAIIETRPKGQNISVYFGSGGAAPQNRTGFRPGPVLTLKTFDGGNEMESWDTVKSIWQKAQPFAVVFRRSIEQMYNPVDARDSFIMEFNAHLRIPETGEYTYMLVSDDAGYLFIDNELVIERNGRHNARDAQRGEFRATVELHAGLHPVRLIVFEAGGGQAAVLAQWKDERNKSVLKPQQFTQSGSTRVTGVEARPVAGRTDCPAFEYSHKSYMSFEGRYYTLTEFAAYNEQPTDWLFGDGAEAAGKRVRHVSAGLQSKTVKARQGKVIAAGQVDFSENPPQRWRMSKSDHFNRYAKQMLAEPLPKLDISTLLHYRHFLKYREYNPQVLPVCEALLAHSELEPKLRNDILLDIGRVAAATDVAKAVKAYSALLSLISPREEPERHRDILLEAATFTLLQAGDTEVGENLLRRFAASLQGQDPAVLRVRIDLALQKGEAELAGELTENLLVISQVGRGQQRNAVRSNALQDRFYQLLEEGFLNDASRVLEQWIAIAPGDYTDGSWPLARARMFNRMGWRNAAISSLQGALALNPLLPNLPEVEYMLAYLYEKTDQTETATELYRKVEANYGNHPAAAKAADRLKELK